MNSERVAKPVLLGLCAGVILALGEGCSAGKETVARTPAEGRVAASVEKMAHEMAMQHFIDGSIFEVKGEFAQAILEYQDALRYEKDPAVYYALSKNYEYLGKHTLAIESGLEAVKLDPDNPDYRRSLANVYIGAFQIDAAAQEYEEIIKRDSSNIEDWYSLARLYQGRRPLKALEVYEQISARFGPEWEVLLQIADLCNKLGKFDRAAAALNQMTEIDPSNEDLKESLAQTYVRAGKLDEALAVYEDLRELYPNNLEYLGEIAGVHLLKKEFDKASGEFETILSRDSVSVETKLHIGELYYEQIAKDSTMTPRALSIFRRIRASNPADWRAYWFLGAIGTQTHDDTLAVSNLKKVTELASWNADAWAFLSTVYLLKNKFDEVVTVLESALRVVPDDFRVNFFLGVAYSRLGRSVDAVRVLEHACQINPRNVDALAQLALVYDGLKQFDESDSLYEQALKIDSTNHLVLNNYGYSLADRGLQLARAESMARKAVEAEPDNSSYLDTMGWVYFRLGRYQEAEEYVKKAIAKGDVSAVVFEHLGDIYFKMDEKDRALEQWNAALKLDEKNTALREKIARESQ